MSHLKNRKFLGPQEFIPQSSEYWLMPFRFHPLGEDREVMVNEVGDFLIVPRGTARQLVHREISKEDPVFRDLVSGFFVSESKFPQGLDVMAARYRTKKSFLDEFTSLHIMVVTLRCNHTCAYCQVSRQTADKHEFDMTEDVLEASLDHMFRSPSPHLTLEFQGGEPLLAFEKVKKGVEGAIERNKIEGRQLTFVLCTNATLLSEEILEFCSEYGILISTSLDGPEFIHNANRRLSRNDSYAEVIKGISKARKYLGEDRVSALMTTSSLSLKHPKEIVDEYRNQGFDHIFLRDISPYGFATRGQGINDTDDFLHFFKTALDYILQLNLGGVHFSEDFSSIILKKMLTPFSEGFVDLQSPAGLINSVAVYNYDGGVYASDESRMLAEVGDDTFRLGSVFDNYEDLFAGEKAFEIAEFWANESLAGCSECGLQTYCGADPVHAYATQGDMAGYRPKSTYCKRNMEVISHLLRLMDDSPEIEKIFRKWIN